MPQLHFVRWGSREVRGTICLAAVGCGWLGEYWFFHSYCTEICSQVRLRFGRIYDVCCHHWPLQPEWQCRTPLQCGHPFFFSNCFRGFSITILLHIYRNMKKNQNGIIVMSVSNDTGRYSMHNILYLYIEHNFNLNVCILLRMIFIFCAWFNFVRIYTIKWGTKEPAYVIDLLRASVT